jgi:hypothetical protein
VTSSSVTSLLEVGAIDDSSSTSEVGARLERLIPLVLMVVVFLAAVLSITSWPVGAFEDDAIYTVLGKALASGEGYRMINLPGAPHATHYPPGYPFLLSLLWRAWPEFPDNVVLFKFVNALLLAAAAFGAFLLVRRRLGHGSVISALIAFAAIAVMPLPQLAGLVLSEPLFVAGLFFTLLAFERAASTGSMRDAAVAGALLGALCLVRTVGVAAVGAAVLVLLARRQFRTTIVLVAMTAVFVVPWQMWVGAHESELAPILDGKYGPYFSWMVDGYRAGGADFAREVVLRNLADIGSSLSFRVMPVELSWLRLLSLSLLLSILIAGLVLLFKRLPALVLFCAFYVALLIAWPFHPYRFLLALWPVLVIAAAAAIHALWHWQARTVANRSFRMVALGVVGFVFAGHVAYNVQAYREGAWIDLQRRVGVGAGPLVEWVMAYTQPDDVISSQQDVLVYLYTGRRAVPPSTFLPRQRLQQLSVHEEADAMGTIVRTFRPKFVVTGWPPHLAAADTLSSGPTPILRRAGSIPNQTVYERIAP